ncbi:MAG: hypothetical protein HOU81_13095 [Hamadaea sp.]|uniref:hypothetical protein n=1 Tax=Hamadaea sp. TaxID=2024425 RepID=UPI001825F439|nr:hypothetical protein [Hamadaea sp.]NUR71752.1 hypothetical protein [Hamadaea sp.]NUT19066.1 hypothetical protein [Hamadaea sp.]
MTGMEQVPRSVRLAVAMIWLSAAAGLLLVLDGLLELYWWSTDDAAKLSGVFRQIAAEYGLQIPALIRDRGGAVELIVLGLICLAGVVLARSVRRGSASGRTYALLLAGATLLFGLFGIGSDLSVTLRLGDYLHQMTTLASSARIPEIEALVYPAWYAWLEDLAQGLQVLAALAVLVTLAYAMIWHPQHFVDRRQTAAVPGDAWGDALQRIRKQRAESQTDA